MRRASAAFVVGTGGAQPLSGTVHACAVPRSVAVELLTYGVLRLTLRPGDYDWRFVRVPGSTFRDSGTGRAADVLD